MNAEIYNYAGFLNTLNGKKYFIEKLIKKGGTSTVFLVSEDISSLNNLNNFSDVTDEKDYSKEYFALKIYDDEQAFESEITCLSEIWAQSEDIVQLHIWGQGVIERGLSNESIHLSDYFECKIKFALFNFIPNGELFDYVIKLQTGFQEFIAKRIFIRILNSLNVCHKNGFIHKDIKLENILVDSNFDVKLIDFGFSHRISEGELNEYLGTKPYSAPEELEIISHNSNQCTNHYTYNGIKTDIFSLGILLFALILGRLPFEQCSFSDQLYRYIAKEDYDLFWNIMDLDYISNDFKSLINRMICCNPEKRINLDEIFEHPWIKNDLSDCKVLNEDYIKEFTKRKRELDKREEAEKLEDEDESF